jgi:Putative transposase, YhgA-like
MSETTANYDDPWKNAITQYFESFMLFFYPAIHQQINWHKTPISLDKELQKITAIAETKKRHADKLYKVWLLDNQELWILIHVEVQSQYDAEFPLRMFIYNYRAFDLHNKPVISLAILGDENPSWRPNSYQYGMGESQVQMNFSIAKLLDYQWSELETSDNPFAVVVMAHLKTKATTSNLTERSQWKWNLVRPLYQRGLTKFDVINLVSFIDKMMTLPPPLQLDFNSKLEQYEQELNMPFLSTIEEMALERGQEKGAKENSQENILDLLKIRFNSLPETLETSLKQIDDLARLKQLVIATISVNSLAEFQDLIDQNSANQN